jgi:hypothetical protein
MLMVLVLASCTSNISDPVPQDKMVFSAVASHSIALQRKSIITTTNYPLDEPFVVEAVHYPNGDESAKGETFMANEPISYDFENMLWKSDSVFFWPERGKLVFYAGSPILPNVTIGPEKGVEADWSIPDNDATQTDLCFAKTVETCEMHPEAVPIVFIHALSQICLKARTIQNYSHSYTEGNFIQSNVVNIVLDSVKVHGIVSKGHFTQIPRGWSYDPADTVSYTVFRSKEGLNLKVDRYDNPELERLTTILLIPQILSEDACLEEWHHAEVRTSLTDTSTGQIVSDLSYTIPQTSVIYFSEICEKWIMDFKYTLRLAVGINGDKSTLAVAVTDWTETKEIILGDE